jgi:1-phosphofructokinase
MMTAITVFCPTPLLTVTIESSLNGGPELHIHAGGQGFWVARMVARLGVPVTLCAPFGGDTGRLLKELMAQENVTLRAVSMAGVNGSYVHDRRTGERVEICRVEGSRLTRHEYDDLFNAAFAAAMDSQLLVLTGQFPVPVLPAAVFKRLARDLRANGRLVAADLTGDDLKEALAGGVDTLCFSDEEMVQQGIAESENPQQLTAGMEAIANRGAKQVILHRGARPTIAWSDHRFLEVIGPQVAPLDHRGGGDTFLAALAVGMVQQMNWEDAIRFSAAAGTLNVMRHGLGTGCLEDILTLTQHVRVQPLSAPAN